MHALQSCKSRRLHPTRRLALLALLSAGIATHAVAGVSGGISITGGNNQSAQIGTAFPAPLSVRVVDENGYAIEGQDVEFVVTPTNGAGAGVSPASVSTDASGNAATIATAGNVTGSYIVTAALAGGKHIDGVNGIVTAVDFTLTNLGGEPVSAIALPALSNLALMFLASMLGFCAWRARRSLRGHS